MHRDVRGGLQKFIESEKSRREAMVLNCAGVVLRRVVASLPAAEALPGLQAVDLRGLRFGSSKGGPRPSEVAAECRTMSKRLDVQFDWIFGLTAKGSHVHGAVVDALGKGDSLGLLDDATRLLDTLRFVLNLAADGVSKGRAGRRMELRENLATYARRVLSGRKPRSAKDWTELQSKLRARARLILRAMGPRATQSSIVKRARENVAAVMRELRPRKGNPTRA